MNMCSDGHVDIVYDYAYCPLCATLKEVQELETNGEFLSAQILDMKNVIKDLQNDIEDYKIQLKGE